MSEISSILDGLKLLEAEQLTAAERMAAHTLIVGRVFLQKVAERAGRPMDKVSVHDIIHFVKSGREPSEDELG